MPNRLLRLRRVLQFIFIRRPAHGQSQISRFRERFPTGLLILTVVISLNAILHHFGLFEKAEWVDLDALLRTQHNDRPQPRVALVLISDDDYKRSFNDISPLSPNTVLDLVAAVCRYSPLMVGVDLATDWPLSGANWDESKLSSLQHSGCHIVWTRDAQSRADISVEPGHSNSSYELGRVLGRDGPTSMMCTALPVFEPDADGVIRRYSKYVKVSKESDQELYVTMPEALTTPGECGLHEFQLDRTSAEKIRYSSNVPIAHLPAEAFLDRPSSSDAEFDLALKTQLRGSIVIVGGSYRQARDKYMTPKGPMLGAEILAQSVRTMSEPIREVNLAILLSIEFSVEAVLLAFVTALNLRLPWALALSAVFSLLVAFYISWELFDYAGYFIGVFGATVGVFLATLGELLYHPIKHDLHQWKDEFLTFLKEEMRSHAP